ncbi:MAG: phosphoribosylglycinamide formyltransferase [Bacillota bacterium]
MLKANVAVLVSGGGTNLQALLCAEAEGKLPSGGIRVVISNRPDAFALARAQQAGVEAVAIDERACESHAQFEELLLDALRRREIDLVVLAGFLSILSKDFVSRYPERILNVHPSLLPSFCGRGCYGLKVHEAALRYGVKITGATVHFVDEKVDGGRILLQKAVEVHERDTPEALQRRVMEQAEWELLPQAVETVCGRIAKEKQA